MSPLNPRQLELWQADDPTLTCSLEYVADSRLWRLVIQEQSNSVMTDWFVDRESAVLASTEWRLRLQRIRPDDDDESLSG